MNKSTFPTDKPAHIYTPHKQIQARTEPPVPRVAVLSEQLALVVLAIEEPSLRQLVHQVFAALAWLLDRLRRLDELLRQDNASLSAHLTLRLVHEQARALTRYIDEEALTQDGLGEGVREALDGVSFVICHELRRTFAGELGEQVMPRRLLRAEAARACGLLTNCLQQATTVLAQAFDPSLEHARLFADVRARCEQSLLLYQALLLLHEHVSEAARAGEACDYGALIKHLQKFRVESMHYLLYRDWDEFERQAEEIAAAFAQGEELAAPLHQFACYLCTLIGHVRMRAPLCELL